MSCCRRDSYNGRKFCHFVFSVREVPESFFTYLKESPRMGMPDESQKAGVLFHLLKMSGELSLSGIEFFPEARKIRTGIVAQEDVQFRGFQDFIFRKSPEKFQVIGAVTISQVIGMQPELVTCQLPALPGIHFIPVFRKGENI